MADQGLRLRFRIRTHFSALAARGFMSTRVPTNPQFLQLAVLALNRSGGFAELECEPSDSWCDNTIRFNN